jgi:hypothetical protein
MNAQIKAVIASYARSFAVAITYASMQGDNSTKGIILAGLAAIVGPGIRAINPKDKAFGIIADKADAEINKLLKAEKTKVVKKTASKKKTK